MAGSASPNPTVNGTPMKARGCPVKAAVTKNSVPTIELPNQRVTTATITPAAFTSPTYSGTQNAISNYPSATSCKPGEPAFLLRLQDFKIRPSADPEYNMNFTPLIRTQTNPDLVVAFLKQAINMYTDSPRDNGEIVGFGY